MNWIKHYWWFVKESKSFMGIGWWALLREGLLTKAFKHAGFMVKWDRMTPEQRELWYINENRVMEF